MMQVNNYDALLMYYLDYISIVLNKVANLVKNNSYFHYIFFSNIPILFLFLTPEIPIFQFSVTHFQLDTLMIMSSFS